MNVNAIPNGNSATTGQKTACLRVRFEKIDDPAWRWPGSRAAAAEWQRILEADGKYTTGD